MLTAEQLTEMEKMVDGMNKTEAPRINSELATDQLKEIVSLRNQIAYADSVADAIDSALGHEKKPDRKPVARLCDQMQGLIRALAECKRRSNKPTA